MGQTTLVIGGCRSGKSSHALEISAQIPGHRRFVATCNPGNDDEMLARVAQHRRDRSKDWETTEVPVNLATAIRGFGDQTGVVLIDCLTLWVGNLLHAGCDQGDVDRHCRELIDALTAATYPTILVSNEVGTGIVPENPLARRFRDVAGFVNQTVAAAAHRVVWMVAGIPVTIKGDGQGSL